MCSVDPPPNTTLEFSFPPAGRSQPPPRLVRTRAFKESDAEPSLFPLGLAQRMTAVTFRTIVAVWTPLRPPLLHPHWTCRRAEVVDYLWPLFPLPAEDL